MLSNMPSLELTSAKTQKRKYTHRIAFNHQIMAETDKCYPKIMKQIVEATNKQTINALKSPYKPTKLTTQWCHLYDPNVNHLTGARRETTPQSNSENR